MKNLFFAASFACCALFSTAARADDSAPCTTTATGPFFNWTGQADVRVVVTCAAVVSSITINNGQWKVTYDNTALKGSSASGLSKTCTNVSTCTLDMNMGSPYISGFTWVTTWSGHATYPSGSATASATYDPWP